MVLDGISKSPHNLNGSIRDIVAILFTNKRLFAVCNGIAPFKEDYVNKGLLVVKQVKRKITNKAYVRKDLKT
jgi:hypothetical protein